MYIAKFELITNKYRVIYGFPVLLNPQLFELKIVKKIEEATFSNRWEKI